ncbi:hypothetical protein WG83_06230 [Proteus mirabilis]|nr:hypothetical protein WG83_06230 [Proteus mirabilis]HEK2081365.1 hypothetical protein [Proteus mirabilis]
MNISINDLKRLNDMMFHGLCLSQEANEALRLAIHMCETVNSYITSVYQKIIFSDNLPMNGKILTLKGCSSTKIYEKHHKNDK